MGAAARIRPQDLFSKEEWGRVNQRSNLMGLGMVLHAWTIIAAATALFAIFPNPLTLLLAVMTIGARQLGLAVLMHEAAHGGLSTNKGLNDWVGNWLCGAPTGASLKNYRDYHLNHHKFAQQEEDPDLGLAAHFPVTRKSLRRKIVRDLTGQTFIKQRAFQFAGALGIDKRPAPGRENRTLSKRRAVYPFLITNLVLLAFFIGIGRWELFFLTWILPMATWFPLVTRLRNIAEHACLTDPNDPYKLARTTYTDPITAFFLAPYWVNYHCEHHMFMYVPFYNLGLAHRLLKKNGVTEKMEIKPSYYNVLSLASSRESAAT